MRTVHTNTLSSKDLLLLQHLNPMQLQVVTEISPSALQLNLCTKNLAYLGPSMDISTVFSNHIALVQPSKKVNTKMRTKSI